MNVAVVVALLFSAAPSLQLAMPGLRCVNVEAETCAFFADHYAQQLSARSGARVTTQSELSTLIGFERQRQLLGCEAESSCIAELAGALGVDGLITGNLAKIADEYVLNVRVLSAKDGSALASDTLRVVGEKRLLDGLSASAARLASQLPGQRSAVPPPPPPEPARPLLGGPAVWGTGLAGLVAGGVGAGLLVGAQGVRTELHDPPANRSTTELDALISRGELYQNVGLGLAIGGGALVAVAATLLLLDGAKPPEVSVQLVPTSGGATVSVFGVLP